MIPTDREEFCKKCRYPNEVAEFLNISKPTLMIWLQDIEGFDYTAYISRKRRLFTPKELKIIFDNVL